MHLFNLHYISKFRLLIEEHLCMYSGLSRYYYFKLMEKKVKKKLLFFFLGKMELKR